jgi:hypothetical protein
MDKFEFMRLWDLYHELLTPHQQEITNLYFNYDLTLSEIAEARGISRQGVSECLNGCKKQLGEWEQKLHFAKMLAEGDLHTSFMQTAVIKALQNFVASHAEFAPEIEKIIQLVEKDYTAEVATALNKGTTSVINKKV